MQKHPTEKLITDVLVLAPEKGSFPHFLKTAAQVAGIFKARVRLLESLNFASKKSRIPAVKPEETEEFHRNYLEAQADQNRVAWDAVIFGDSLQKALKRFSINELLILLKGDASFNLKGVFRGRRIGSCRKTRQPFGTRQKSVNKYNRQCRHHYASHCGFRKDKKTS